MSHSSSIDEKHEHDKDVEVSSGVADDKAQALLVGKWTRRYRSPWFSVFVTGVAAFTAPGIWASMNSLGAGGTASVQLVNTANALLYSLMTVTCILGPFVTRLIGFRYTLALGTVGYPVYAAGLYLVTYNGTTWLAYVGSALCGISAGFFWSVEGAVTTGYPLPHHKGRSIALWLTFRDLGIFVGGCVTLALNINRTSKGSVGYGTYKAFIAIQCLGVPVSLLLSNPDQVIRSDGSHPESTQAPTWKKEAKALWALFLTKPILLLTPLFWYFGWRQSYPGTYFATYFSVRARALGSFLYSIEAAIATWLVGVLLDTRWASRQTRATIVFAFMAVIKADEVLFRLAYFSTSLWIWFVIIQKQYHHKKGVRLDWSDQSTFGPTFGVYNWSIIGGAMVENFIYWAIGNLSEAPGEQIRYSALLRGIETSGVAVGFGVQAAPADLLLSAILNLVFWVLALPSGALATLQVVKKFRKQSETTGGGGLKDHDNDPERPDEVP